MTLILLFILSPKHVVLKIFAIGEGQINYYRFELPLDITVLLKIFGEGKIYYYVFELPLDLTVLLLLLSELKGIASGPSSLNLR